MMPKLSVLIFSRNDAKVTIDLIKEVYPFADDIVLVDSSTKEESEKLHRAKSKYKFDKLRIFYVVALSYPDPFRMYAIKKCKYDWVLLLDIDERLSSQLKSGIKQIIDHPDCNAFALRRYEHVQDGTGMSYFTWQVRLFNKEYTSFKGLIHEQPIIKGRVTKLEDGDYYTMHVAKLMQHSGLEYNKMEKFMRLTYKAYNERMLDYLAKSVVPKDESIEKTLLGRFVKFILIAYERLTFKKENDEPTNFDYFMLYVSRELLATIRQGKFRDVPYAYRFGLKYVNRIKEWKNEPDAKENFEISKLVNKYGVIRFLDLENPNTVKTLNEKYKSKRQGIELLFKLLKERYCEIQHKRSY